MNCSCIDDASTDNTSGGCSVGRGANYPNIRLMPFRRSRRVGHGPPDRHQQVCGEIVVWTDADMTYENRADPRTGPPPPRRPDLMTRSSAPGLTGRAPTNGFGCQAEVAHPQDRRAPDQPEDPRSQFRPPRVPARRVPALSAAAAGGFLLRHDGHHRLPVQPARHPLCADQLCERAGTSRFHFVRDAYRFITPGAADGPCTSITLKVLMPMALWLVVIQGRQGSSTWFVTLLFPCQLFVLLVVSGIMIGSLALLADLVVRSRDGVSIPASGSAGIGRLDPRRCGRRRSARPTDQGAGWPSTTELAHHLRAAGR